MSRSCHFLTKTFPLACPCTHGKTPSSISHLPSTDFISDKHLIHARKSPFPIIPSPVNKTHSLPQLRFCNFFRPLSYPPSQYNSTSPGCNPSLLPTTALTFLDLTQSFPSLSPVHHPNITQCFPSASVPAFNPSSTFSPLANFCPPNVLPLFRLLFPSVSYHRFICGRLLLFST